MSSKTFAAICILLGAVTAVMWIVAPGTFAVAVSIVGGAVIAIAAMNIHEEDPYSSR